METYIAKLVFQKETICVLQEDVNRSSGFRQARMFLPCIILINLIALSYIHVYTDEYVHK